MASTDVRSSAQMSDAAPERTRRPAIVAVDDEPAVLAAVARDLRREFGESYRVLRAGSGEEALDVVRVLDAPGWVARPPCARKRPSHP